MQNHYLYHGRLIFDLSRSHIIQTHHSR